MMSAQTLDRGAGAPPGSKECLARRPCAISTAACVLALATTMMLSCASLARADGGSPKVWGSVRARTELWNWFDPGNIKVGRENDYAFEDNLIKLDLGWNNAKLDSQVEIASASLLGLPGDAVAPGAAGQLGLGGTYKAVNGGADGSVWARQAWVHLKRVPSRDFTLKLGRFEISEGAESLTGDPTLDWLKNARIAERFIGTFGYAAMQRTFDGMSLVHDSKGANTTVTAFHPTAGGFDLHAWRDLSQVNVVYAAQTIKDTSARKTDDARVFFIYYDDQRPVLKTDSRALAARKADKSDIAISTLGADYLKKLGEFDLLLWGAWQWGNWGVLDQRSWGFDTELGWQPRHTAWKPWLRVGTCQTSGDDNAKDTVHRTFFQILPTVRAYSRFPFFNMENLRDTFAMLLLRPSKKTLVRADFHNLQLTEVNDQWYTGAGAFQIDSFGYVGRPTGGFDKLADFIDVSVDQRLGKRQTLGVYYSRAVGGGVPASIYPASANADYTFVEYNYKF